MSEFLVELFVPRRSAPAVEAGVRRALRGDGELAPDGPKVRCLRSIFVPEDETWFLLFEAATADDVRDAARSADLVVERISSVAARSDQATEKR